MLGQVGGWARRPHGLWLRFLRSRRRPPQLFLFEREMAGRITNLRFQKRTDERVNVYLDGAYAFALPALEAARLRIGQELSDAEIEALRLLDERHKAYDRAVNFLSYRPRSTAEVRRNLSDAGYDEELIELAVERLTAQGYLDDAAFARYWVENRQSFRPRGKRALTQELRQRGVDAEPVEAALESLDQAAGAYSAARPRAERLAALAASDPMAFRRKLSEFLLRRGFDYDIVKETVSRLALELGSDAEDAPVED